MENNGTTFLTSPSQRGRKKNEIMSEEKKVPKIVNDIVEFFKYWDNPDEEKGEYKSIKGFQLAIYGPSMNFVFKWLVTDEELKQVSEYTEIDIVDCTLCLSLGDYNIELSSKVIKTENAEF